jgi:competence protein ComGF
MLVIPIITYKVTDAFDCILMSLQFLRIYNLIALLVYFVSSDSKDTSDNDTISQYLLTSQDTTGYRATTATPNNVATTKQDNKINKEQHDA